MSREFLDIRVNEVAARAPRPQAFYDRYCEDSLDIIEARWPTRAGYVCLVQCRHAPAWVMVRQTPDLGLMTSFLDRWSLDDDYEVIASRRVKDRFRALDVARRCIGRIAAERKNHTAGTAEWFKAGLADAKASFEKA